MQARDALTMLAINTVCPSTTQFSVKHLYVECVNWSTRVTIYVWCHL